MSKFAGSLIGGNTDIGSGSDMEFLDLDSDELGGDVIDDKEEFDYDADEAEHEDVIGGEDGENVDASEKGEASGEDDEGDTAPYVLGTYWKEMGYISEDAEIKEGITHEQLAELYKARLDKEQAQDKENYRKEWLAEYSDRLIGYGINPDSFFEDKNMFQTRQLISAYESLIETSYDEAIEKDGDIPRAAGIEYYMSKGIDRDEAERFYDRDLDDKDEEELYNRNQQSFTF